MHSRRAALCGLSADPEANAAANRHGCPEASGGLREGIATLRCAATARGRWARLAFSKAGAQDPPGFASSEFKKTGKGSRATTGCEPMYFAPEISTPPPGRQGPSARQGGVALGPLQGVSSAGRTKGR
jgi:hypothetical protein